jgi:fatty acid desaturase
MVAALVAADRVGRAAVTVLLAVVVASLFKGLNNIVHECSHNAFAEDARFNRFLGTILCVLLLMDFQSYKREHTSHHRYLGDYDRDLDFQLRRGLGHDRRFRWRRMLRDTVSLRFVRYYVPRVRLRHPHHLVGLSFYAVLLIGLLAVGACDAAVILFLAHVLFMPWLRYFIDIVDHGGLYRADVGELYKSRNFVVGNFALRWLLFPRNDCYHLIHHLYPYLPIASFGKVHAVLLEDPAYRGLRHRAELGGFRPAGGDPEQGVIREYP